MEITEVSVGGYDDNGGLIYGSMTIDGDEYGWEAIEGVDGYIVSTCDAYQIYSRYDEIDEAIVNAIEEDLYE